MRDINSLDAFVESEQYGRYELTLLGKIDFSNPRANPVASVVWLNKYHPHKYFDACVTSDAPNYKGKPVPHGGCLWVQVPTKVKNPKLPIACTEKRIEKWIDAAKAAGVLEIP